MEISTLVIQTAIEFCKENNCTTYDINNGYCEEFAADIIEKLGGYTDSTYEMSGDMFFNVREPSFAKKHWGDVLETVYGVWSYDMLRRWGFPPMMLEDVKDELNHTWLYHNGKHYDAECPYGVENWFDLPLNKKFFKKYTK